MMLLEIESVWRKQLRGALEAWRLARSSVQFPGAKDGFWPESVNSAEFHIAVIRHNPRCRLTLAKADHQNVRQIQRLAAYWPLPLGSAFSRSAGDGRRLALLRAQQKRRSMSGVFLQLVPAAGIELATFALRMRCSTN
jgi:hypothetical protein